VQVAEINAHLRGQLHLRQGVVDEREALKQGGRFLADWEILELGNWEIA
jgi:hypothetical protein